MINRHIHQDHLMDNVRFRYILKRNDPVAPPSQASLSALEADILAYIDASSQRRVLIDAPPISVGVLQQGWAMHAVAFVALLVLVCGFIVGQMSSGSTTVPLIAGEPSLLAFADETLWQSMGSSDAAVENVGDTDDNAE